MSTDSKKQEIIAQRIAQAFLHGAVEKLKQDELNESEFSEVEAEYRQALETLNTDAIRKQVLDDLETYFAQRLAAHDWSRADRILTILQNLGVVNNKKLTSLKTGRLLSQAETELAADHLDAAFACLKDLDDKTRTQQGKSLVKTYIQDKARQGRWFAGDAALKRLVGLLTGDEEALAWRVNWLFIWAKTLFPQDEVVRKPARAKCLGQKILELAPPETLIINLLSDATSPEKDTSSLCDQTYSLLGDILLVQTRTCLNLPDLAEASHLFQATLALPNPPEQALITLAFDQVRLSLQADQPEQVFAFLNHLKTKLNDAERAEVKDLIYRFSRLYAGRDRWSEAKQLLGELRDWLNPADERIELWLDDLNREWLAFVKASRLPEAVSPAEIKRQVLEVKVADEGYSDAERLKLNTQSDWANTLIEAGLALGKMYLDTDNLAEASQSYHKVLTVKEHKVKHEDQISHSLHSYSQYMLNQECRDKARQALNELRKFNLAAPDPQTRPDPRIDGSIQRIILAEAWACLSANQVKEAFTQLPDLPELWPIGQIKKLVKDYSQERCHKNKWSEGITALEGLNEFLHDQESLEWLVDSLEQWGWSLKEKGDLERAAEVYEKAITRTRQTTRRKAVTLADVYIRQVALELAQGWLDHNLQISETSTAINKAVEWYGKILTLAEHHNEHETLVNHALRKHALNLAKIHQWSQAHQALDKLDELYQFKGRYKTLFAGWRRELILHEVEMWLKKSQLNEAFERLKWLKNWLDTYEAPEASWLEQAGAVKEVYRPFYQTWLDKKKWFLALQASEHLGSLLPKDSEVKGWEVKALDTEGQALQKQNHLEEALDCYERALAKAPGQPAVPELDIQKRALKTRLTQAQQCLDEDKFPKAITIYDEALKQPGDHPNRADDIRQALKAYSDYWIKQRKWEKAQQALDYLRLHLDNNDVLGWLHDLILEKVKIIMHEQDDIDAAFAELATMPQPHPLDRIQEIVEVYGEDRAKANTWEKALKALNCTEGILDKNISAYERLANHAKKLGRQLDTLDTLRGAEKLFELEDGLRRTIRDLRSQA